MTDNANHKLLRLPDIVGPDGCLPISASTWWDGVKSGRYPKPVRLGPRIVAWRVCDIERLLQEGVDEEG